MILNYLGSKARFAPVLNRVLDPVIKQAAKSKGGPVVFGDLFAGTGFVGNYYKDHTCVSAVVSSDLELYSYVVCKALLNVVLSQKLIRIIGELNGAHLKPLKGLIWEHFSPAGGRKFFTEANAMRIDGIRVAMAELYKMKKITYNEYLFLLASLIASCSRIANSASCFRAYLKQFCPRSLKRFVLQPVHKQVSRCQKTHKVSQRDAVQVATEYNLDVVYLDPPYNANHYGGYYSFYNYLLRYEREYEITGVAGVTKVYNKSAFGLKASSKCVLQELLQNLKTRGTRFIVMSYNSDGVLDKNEISSSMLNFGEVCLYKTINRKFRPNDKVKHTHVIEYIFVLNMIGPKGVYKEHFLNNEI